MRRRDAFQASCIALANLWLAGSVSFGAVTTTGQVNPTDPTTWTASTPAYVGQNVEGGLAVDGASRISSGTTYIGVGSQVVGKASISGDETVWNATGALHVGDFGVGVLTIVEGATLYSGYGNRDSGVYDSYIGNSSGSRGEVTAAGLGSEWRISERVIVGNYGEGTVTVLSGAMVTSRFGTLGRNPESSGAIVVAGAGSLWHAVYSVSLGGYGTGSVLIRDGGEFSCENCYFGTTLGGSGQVTVSGAKSLFRSRRILEVGSYGSGTLSIENGAAVNSNYSYVGSSRNSSGVVTVNGVGATWHNSRDLYVGRSGTGMLSIAVGGSVDVGDVENPYGISLAEQEAGSGSIDLDDGGMLRLYGGSVVQGSGSATFNFDGGRLEGVKNYSVGAGLTQNGGVLAPGNSTGITTIVGSYAVNSGALEIELLSGSGVAGTAFDRLVVNSGVTLGVSSQLNLLLGYAANVGDSFLIVDSKNSAPINGTFANDDALTAEFESLRYSFSLSYAAGTGNDIALTVASVSLIGDYNGDGFVDAADYTVWQDAAGTTVAAYAGADGNGDGVVDEGDHAVWAAHYGASLETVMAQAVPEPAGVVLALLALIAGGRRRVCSGCSAA